MSLYTPAMLADLVGVDVARIRSWQRRGWIVPIEETHRLAQFNFAELTTARQLAELHRAGIRSATIDRKLAEIRRRAPHIQRPLSELAIVLDGRQMLLREGANLVESSGQLRIDFAALEQEPETEEPAATIISPAVFLSRGKVPSEAAPEQLAAWAADLEEAGDLPSAAEMYRAALASGGPQPVICFQLAELLYRSGDLAGARERYYAALELDEDYVEARANLGCLLLETGERELAIAAFEGALRSHEAYPDVHYHLARTLDEMNRADEAAVHWRRFLELSPDSPWADEARHRLSTSC